ncbi:MULTISPECIES: hypothetical protein [Vagococcus]|uniref:Uncharacterized protein n=1 Tax=Vagococcus fluvialis bH819 TaxID=1255619 RepID=A0A1X6WS61_9ENTE|nr:MULTISPECIES: hypothetical protein [Vagococcus]SLM87098.1 hypothetical protein FM121_13450 [Vagococcus fluvialis bH819]HCM90622.1 hypothetical protein [Vagococcus sp.]
MIEKKLVSVIQCIDNNQDDLKLVETIVFNTIALNLKVSNDLNGEGCVVTSMILDRESAKELGEALLNWVSE